MKFLLFPVMARKNLLQQCPHEHRTRQQCMISASHQSSNHNAVVAETTVAKLPTFKKHPFNFRNGKLFLSTTACKAKTAGEAKGRWANTTSTIFCIEVSVSPLLDWNNRSTPCSQPRYDGNTMGRAALNIAAHKWVPKGRRRGGTQTEMGGYLEHRNAQLCSVLPLLSSALAEASHSVQLSTAPNKSFCKQKRLQWLFGVSYSGTSELLRRTLALKMANEKIYVFFHTSSIFLGRGSLPGRSCINLRKRYPEVWHLINTLLYSIRSFALLSRTSPCQPCCAEIYCFKTKE